MLIERREFSANGRAYRVSAATDIDDQRRLQDELFQRAYFDGLTQLPNRGLFEQAVGQSIRRRRGEPPNFAVAVVGFDQFDAVNEFYGRAVGDALLAEAARRIAGQLDEATWPPEPAATSSRFWSPDAPERGRGQGEDRPRSRAIQAIPSMSTASRS